MKNWICIFLLIHATEAFAQWYNPENIPKKLGYKYGIALNESQLKNYDKALALLDECIAADSKFVDAWLSKAGIFADQKKYAASVQTYEKGILLDTVYSFNFLLPYSISLAGVGRFNEALFAINKFLSKPNLSDRFKKSAYFRKKSYEFAVQFANQHKNDQYIFTPQNLGDNINSTHSEYFPSLTIDGSQLVFTRRVNNNEDFYVSEKTKESWNTAIPMPGNVNSLQNEGAQNISQDGKLLVYTACNREDGEGSCDLYISYLMKDKWSEGQNMGRNINTDQWESQPCLSPDKRSLYFAARLPEGFGGSDLYVSQLQANGKWGIPVNMGPEINTIGDESSPFIHADNQTFYFTSNGHPGYGGTDLFLMRRNINGTWTNPENLGYPINTINDEGTLIVSADGSTAYYASDRSDSKGSLDIYQFNLPVYARPLITYWVSGKVFDEKNKEGLPAVIELIELKTGNLISKIQTNDDGTYLVPLPSGKNYVFNVARKGYLFYSSSFLLERSGNDSVYKKDIPLTPIEEGSKIVLNNIFFHTGSAELQSSSAIELGKVVQMLQDNQSLRIEISGHTDNIGKAADNLTLSNNRAKAVVDFLISKGVAPRRLISKGFGAIQPISENNTEEGRSMNRRTELKVLGKE
jgi:outer membrane protein OmpA-like peptidoglycan-associated protein/tetratricopeptide (TPR) repeat protein